MVDSSGWLWVGFPGVQLALSPATTGPMGSAPSGHSRLHPMVSMSPRGHGLGAAGGLLVGLLGRQVMPQLA